MSEATDQTMGEAIEMRPLNEKTNIEKKREEYKVQVKKMDALSKLVRDGFYDFRIIEEEHRKIAELLNEILLEEEKLKKQKQELEKKSSTSLSNWFDIIYQADQYLYNLIVG